MTIAHPAAAFEMKSDDIDPAEAVTKALADLKGSVDTRLAGIEQKSADRLDKLEARLNRPAATVETKEGSPERKAFGTYLRGGKHALSADEQKTLVVTDGSGSGGILAPVEIGNELIKLLVQWSPLRAYCDVKTLTARSVTYPRRTASTTAVWVGETSTVTASDMAFEQLALATAVLRAQSALSREMIEDNAYDIQAELNADFAEQFGVAESRAFINGVSTLPPDGKPPVGMLQASGLRTFNLPKLTGTAGNYALASADTADALIASYHALPAPFRSSAAWMMNSTTLAAVRKLKNGVGDYLVLNGLAPGLPATLLGRPIIEAVEMPDMAPGVVPIIFADFSGYRIVDRVAFDVFVDPYTGADNDLIKYRARKRVGGDVIRPDRFLKLLIPAS